MPSDKGGEFCAIGLDVYKELGLTHLADTSIYQPISRITAKTIEAKINKAWKTICRERNINWRIERSFVTNNSSLATFHHLIKTHKPGSQLKIRPIVASRGSPTEKINWLLTNILGPLLKRVPTHLPDSELLISAISSASPQTLSAYQHQCSLDVEALYTSIPIDEAMITVRNKLDSEQITPCPLQTEDVLALLRSVVSLTYFHFEGSIYRQVSGLPMGCAVSGIVAILFMERIERRALDEFARCPIFLR